MLLTEIKHAEKDRDPRILTALLDPVRFTSPAISSCYENSHIACGASILAFVVKCFMHQTGSRLGPPLWQVEAMELRSRLVWWKLIRCDPSCSQRNSCCLRGLGSFIQSTSASGVACLDLIPCGQSQHRCLPHISITVPSSPDPSRSWCHVLALQNDRSNKHLFVTQTQYFLKATKRNKALIVQGPLDLVRASLACTAEQVSEESLCRY